MFLNTLFCMFINFHDFLNFVTLNLLNTFKRMKILTKNTFRSRIRAPVGKKLRSESLVEMLTHKFPKIEQSISLILSALLKIKLTLPKQQV